MNIHSLSFATRWALWSTIAVLIGVAVMMATLIFGPDLPEVVGNGLIGAFLGIAQGRLLREEAMTGAARRRMG